MSNSSEIEKAPHLILSRGRIESEFESPVFAVEPFDRAVLSWNSTGPASFEIEINGARHVIGKWGIKPEGQKSPTVDVDTLSLDRPADSIRFHVQPEHGAQIRLVALTYWKHGEFQAFSARPSAAWGSILPVPERSQMVEAVDALRICSPTSTAMVLEFHGVLRSTREIAEGVYDHAQNVYGNWPFNTAHIYRVSGLESFVRHGSGLDDLENEISAGRPVIIGHRWSRGELDHAPIAESSGHLIVVIGFTESGDVVVNDPAGQPGSVRRVYKRKQIHHTWLERGSGIMYVVNSRH